MREEGRGVREEGREVMDEGCEKREGGNEMMPEKTSIWTVGKCLSIFFMRAKLRQNFHNKEHI